MISTVSTGVEGLDKRICGYPRGRSTLIIGSAGSGKTIMALQFSMACLERGEKVKYVATEERTDDLKSQALDFGWDLEQYEEQGAWLVVPLWKERAKEAKYDYASKSRVHRMSRIIQSLEDEEANVIIDNIGVYAIGMEIGELREQLDLLSVELENKGSTSLIVCDEAIGEMHQNVAMHATFGAVRLLKRDNPFTDRRERALEIIKMRHARVPIDYLLFEITSSGIQVMDTDVHENK